MSDNCYKMQHAMAMNAIIEMTQKHNIGVKAHFLKHMLVGYNQFWNFYKFLLQSWIKTLK